VLRLGAGEETVDPNDVIAALQRPLAQMRPIQPRRRRGCAFLRCMEHQLVSQGFSPTSLHLLSLRSNIINDRIASATRRCSA
jgi:hypothetical protein